MKSPVDGLRRYGTGGAVDTVRDPALRGRQDRTGVAHGRLGPLSAVEQTSSL